VRQSSPDSLPNALMVRHPICLKDPDDLARLDEFKLALDHLRGLIIIDEIQRRPELFPVLRVLVDRPKPNTRFLILGSASPHLLKQPSESLAGRIIYHPLNPFACDEVYVESMDKLWSRGGFPRSFLSSTRDSSLEWRRAFLRTFFERDLPQLGFQLPSTTLSRFWRILAHYHEQIRKGAKLSRAFGVVATTVRRYLDVLSGSLVDRQLLPWQENSRKRQIKSPKIYISDQGLLHSLLGIETIEDLQVHPKICVSWEGFVLQEIITHLGVESDECFLGRTHAGAELDLLITRGRKRIGFEIQRTTAPRAHRSVRAAIDDLKLDSLYVIHAGSHTFPLEQGIRALAFEHLFTDIKPLYTLIGKSPEKLKAASVRRSPFAWQACFLENPNSEGNTDSATRWPPIGAFLLRDLRTSRKPGSGCDISNNTVHKVTQERRATCHAHLLPSRDYLVHCD
jgi:predicted AAA+ superfamily ATPase